jgi:threonyl-tRNA synthetase
MAKRELYERSGHWAHYQDDMYPPMKVGTEQVVLRPMNCPHHILVYRSEPRTSRDIPFRLPNSGPCSAMSVEQFVQLLKAVVAGRGARLLPGRDSPLSGRAIAG